MAIITYAYFVKDSDNVVYDIINCTNCSEFQDKRRSDWLAVEGQSVIEQDFVEGTTDSLFINKEYVLKDGESVVLNESKFIADKKANLKTNLAKYRWEITHGSVGGLPPVAYCGSTPIFCTDDARLRLDVSANSAIRKTYTPADTFRFKGVDGTWSDVLVKDMVEWPEMLTETEQRFFEKEEEVEILIDALSTKSEAEAFDVEAELDILVKPILSADLTTYAYPIKYHNEDL